MRSHGERVWNVYILIDTSKSVDIETQKNYEITISKIIHKFPNSYIYESSFTLVLVAHFIVLSELS